MSDSENKQLFNQKLIKIKPIRSIQHTIEDEPIDSNKELETIQDEIESMQQELLDLAQKKKYYWNKPSEQLNKRKTTGKKRSISWLKVQSRKVIKPVFSRRASR